LEDEQEEAKLLWLQMTDELNRRGGNGESGKKKWFLNEKKKGTSALKREGGRQFSLSIDLGKRTRRSGEIGQHS